LSNILIVEDEPLVIEVLQMILSEQYRTCYATTIIEARSCLRSSVVDVIILDKVLPDGNAREIVPLAEELGIPVIQMTGYPQDSAQPQKHPCLMKPFEPDTLLNEVRLALERRLLARSRQGTWASDVAH
jgi:DNA-binding NtrC family response regulator